MAASQVRIPLVRNPKYQRDGLKSYAYLLAKFGISPTQPGPYFMGKHALQQGKFKSVVARIGGKTRFESVLMKRHGHHHHGGASSGGSTGGTTPGGTSSGTAPAGTAPSTTPSTGDGTEQAGEVPATDIQHDAEYLCPVNIGTPAQKLMLDFDTGSSDLWVWSTELPKSSISQYAAQHTIFDPSKSSTFQASSGSTWQIQYGDSSTASGTVGTDTVAIGGITIEKQAVELADTLSAQFLQGAGDGLLGLAWGSINTVKPQPVATPVENMIAQTDIPKTAELFTAHLGNWQDASNADGSSFYTFGYIDADVLKAAGTTEAEIHYTPVDNSQGFWMFSSSSASVNGTAVAQSGNKAIADTGTTLALVSDEVCKAIYAAIPGAQYDSSQQGYLFPSSTALSALPTVQFDVGGKLFTVQKQDLSFADAGNGMVYGGIQSRGDMTFDILGDTFLKGIYAVFDQGNTRFGAVQRTAPSASS